MSTEHWWSGTGGGKSKSWAKNVFHFHFVRHISHTGLGSNPILRGDRPATDRLSLQRPRLTGTILKEFNPYRAVNTPRLCYKILPVNAV